MIQYKIFFTVVILAIHYFWFIHHEWPDQKGKTPQEWFMHGRKNRPWSFLISVALIMLVWVIL